MPLVRHTRHKVPVFRDLLANKEKGCVNAPFPETVQKPVSGAAFGAVVEGQGHITGFLQLRPAGYCYGIPTPEQRRQKKRQYQEPSLHNHPPIQPRPTVSKPSDRPRCSGFTYRCSIRRNSGKIHPENLPRRSPRNYSRRIKKISAKNAPCPSRHPPKPIPASTKRQKWRNSFLRNEKNYACVFAGRML